MCIVSAVSGKIRSHERRGPFWVRNTRTKGKDSVANRSGSDTPRSSLSIFIRISLSFLLSGIKFKLFLGTRNPPSYWNNNCVKTSLPDPDTLQFLYFLYHKEIGVNLINTTIWCLTLLWGDRLLYGFYISILIFHDSNKIHGLRLRDKE